MVLYRNTKIDLIQFQIEVNNWIYIRKSITKFYFINSCFSTKNERFLNTYVD
jgi:hypothetical protein